MAKKKETKVEEIIPQPEKVLVKEPVVEKPKRKDPIYKKAEDGWEIRDRMYRLKGNKKPLSRSIKSADIYYFDEEKGYERELKYCSNQRTMFVDEMKGDQRLEHVVFRNGMLIVEKEKTVLQKLLSLYHPQRNVTFYEEKPVLRAINEVETIELEIDALTAARNLEVDMAEAVMRVEIGSKVSGMSSKELRRDLLIFAKKNPKLFLELIQDDNVVLRNFGIKAVELKILSLSNDQRHFIWKSTGRKIMTVPFDEHPYTALAHWFKTDEGMEVYNNIEKRLK